MTHDHYTEEPLEDQDLDELTSSMLNHLSAIENALMAIRANIEEPRAPITRRYEL